MRVTQRETDDVLIVDLAGQLVAGTGDVELNGLVNQALADGRKKMILNLSEVTRLDSSGLGELVSSAQLAKRFGSSIRLVRPQPAVRRVLEIAHLLPAFDLHETEEEAISAFD